MEPFVLVLGQQQCARRSAVTAGAAGLLVPSLDRLRHADVDDGPNIGLVNAHSKSVGRDYNVNAAVHEAALNLGALLAVQTSVVGDDLDSKVCGEIRRNFGRLLARAGINNRRTRLRRCQRGGELGAGVAGRLRRRDGEGKVWTVKAGRNADRLVKSEPLCDVARDLRRGGCRRSEDRIGAEPAGGVAEAEVVGAEVVTPLRNAVRLINDEAANLNLFERLKEAGRSEALGRHVKQPQLAALRALHHLAVGRRVLLGVNQRDLAADTPLERLDLIEHQ